MKVPAFWTHPERTFLASLLTPLSLIYRGLTKVYRCIQTPYRAKVPVLCVGNITLGGAGKTPAVLALGALLKKRGKRIHFVSRGYGGILRGPALVSANHTSGDVGDEPLLLSTIAPTWIARNRREGVQAAEAAGAEVILLDDGFQNFSIIKSKTIVVVDGKLGFGNRRLFPAGPLREPVKDGLARTDLILLIGAAKPELLDQLPPQKLHRARIVPDHTILSSLKNKKIVAFAGLAYPEKFFGMLQDLDLEVMETLPFPDHYMYRSQDFDKLLKCASHHSAKLLTTEKDHVRLSAQMKKMTAVLPIKLIFDDPDRFTEILGLSF